MFFLLKTLVLFKFMNINNSLVGKDEKIQKTNKKDGKKNCSSCSSGCSCGTC